MFGITLNTYRLDGQVCIKFGAVVPLFIYKMVDNTMEFQSRWFGHEIHGVVDQLIDKKGLEHQILYKLDRPDGMCIFIYIYTMIHLQYRLFILRSIAQFFTHIYMNCFVSSS